MKRAGGLLVALVVMAIIGGCSDGDGGDDIDLFCERINDLIDDDPFERLPDEATAGDLRRAFDALGAGADGVAEVAPDELRALARQYARATAALDDLLAGAGYRGDEVDPLEYRQAARAHAQAASSLEVAAGSTCPGVG
jgi:hypothetical protein